LQKQSGLGFASKELDAVAKSQDDMVMAEVRRVFNPEFLNRLDEVILFPSLTDEDLLQIIVLLVGSIKKTARPLRRLLQKHVEDPLSEALKQGGKQMPETLEV